jgi:hypothetical protein
VGVKKKVGWMARIYRLNVDIVKCISCLFLAFAFVAWSSVLVLRSAFCLIFLRLFSTDVKLRSKSRKVDLNSSALRVMRMTSEAIVLEQRKGMVEQWTSRDAILVHPQLSLKLYLMNHSMT